MGPRTERFLGIKISMQSCKSIVALVFECYFFITSSCIVMYVGMACTMMMSVLQEINILLIFSRRNSSFQNVMSIVHMVYLFWHKYGLHYNVLSGPLTMYGMSCCQLEIAPQIANHVASAL